MTSTQRMAEQLPIVILIYFGRKLKMKKYELLLKKMIFENLTSITFFVFFTLLFHFSLFALAVEKKSMSLESQQEKIIKAVVEADTERDLTIRGELLAKTIKQQKSAMLENIVSSALNLKIQKEIQKHIHPEMLIKTFLKNIDKIRATSKKKTELKPLLSRSSHLTLKSLGGSISGTITVDGLAPNVVFPVLAFDSHGYFAGEAEVNAYSGEYLLTDLQAGSYYVITWSHLFVDEIYPDQLAAIGSLEAWRNAQTIAVTADDMTPDINFDLQKGTVISGEITTEEGIEYFDVTLEITRASSQSIILITDASVVAKKYQITVPGNGDYKISALVPGFIKEWYQEVDDWHHATSITISPGDSIKENINFTLTFDAAGYERGTIGGTLLDPNGGFDYGTMPIFAFDANDTTFSGFGIAIGFLGGSILELYLKPGNYYLYANDPSGGLISTNSVGESYMGVFYPSTHLITEAETIPVVAGEETIPDSSFVLQFGGAITGKVTGPQGEGLDSLAVIAVQEQGRDDESNPDFTKLQIAFGVTDSTGNYTLTGLTNGEYIVRTLSSLPLDSLNEMLGLYVFPRAIYAGQFVDEYYENIKNVFDLDHVIRVPVLAPQTTSGIDFQLDPVGYITGNVTKAEDSRPIDDILILALNDTSGYPELTLGVIDSTGDYILGPLVTGSYKVLAVSGFLTNQQHLTEFYDGARLFQNARNVEVSAPLLTENINFTLDRGAIIQGFVDVDVSNNFYQAGADTMDGAPVIIYHDESGKVASYDFVQFNGGFRVNRLLPGTYKASVMPASNTFATTYAGGGTTFDDPLNTSLKIGYGEVTDINIEIGNALGSISGRIFDLNTQQPVSKAMVIAYDQTGHPVGVAMSDMDFITGNVLSTDGSYRIVGLRSGSYFLRTFAITSLLPLVESLMGLADLEIMEIVVNPGAFLNLSLEGYADKWYPDIENIPAIDAVDLLISFASYGISSEQDQSLFPVYLPMPLFSPIPDEATLVDVTEGAETTDINFALKMAPLEEFISTSVEKINSKNVVPKDFFLSQNFPNPFNPNTNFFYSLPKKGVVRLTVYDLLGREVRTLLHKGVQAGTHSGFWNGRDKDGAAMPSAIYIIRLESQNQNQAIKATLIR
jgi:hypothetical protein